MNSLNEDACGRKVISTADIDVFDILVNLRRSGRLKLSIVQMIFFTTFLKEKRALCANDKVLWKNLAIKHGDAIRKMFRDAAETRREHIKIVGSVRAKNGRYIRTYGLSDRLLSEMFGYRITWEQYCEK